MHIRKVYACLAVTCHLHFWQNDRDFLRATVVTRGWNGYRNKSQHRKSTLEKKILPPFQQGFEPATFQSRVRCSNHWAIPAPKLGALRGTLFKARNRSECSSLCLMYCLAMFLSNSSFLSHLTSLSLILFQQKAPYVTNTETNVLLYIWYSLLRPDITYTRM